MIASELINLLNSRGDSIPPYNTPLLISADKLMSSGLDLALFRRVWIASIRSVGNFYSISASVSLFHLTPSKADLKSMKQARTCFCLIFYT